MRFGENKGARQDEIRLDCGGHGPVQRPEYRHYPVDRKAGCVGVSRTSRAIPPHPDGLTRLSGSRASLIESSKSFITDYWGAWDYYYGKK